MEYKEFDVEEVLSQLTLEEKANMVGGRDFWHTFPMHRLGVPSIRFCDGPGGVAGPGIISDPMPTAAIPSGSVLSCSWNVDLMHKVGEVLADQARVKGVHVIFAPNINMFRHVLGGRSFESYGEDPLLAGVLASSYVNGIRSKKVIACPKHLICNDKEEIRMQMNVDVSERALREIYLLPFMLVHKNADPEILMTSYNRINGLHGCENKHVMKEIIEQEWGFDGCYISDWFGTTSCCESLNAGLHLEMPGPPIWRGQRVTNAIYHNKLTEETLDRAVRGVLKLVNAAIRTGIPEDAKEGTLINDEISQITLQAAKEALVLLKNEDNILPLTKQKKVLVVGQSAKWANVCAGGACTVIPHYAVTLYDALVKNLGESNVDWVKGAPVRKTLPSLANYAKDKTKTPIKYSMYDEPRTVADRKPFGEKFVSEVDVFIYEFDRSKIRPGHRFSASYSLTINVPKSANYRFNLKVGGTSRVFLNGELIAEHITNYATGSDMGMNAPEIFKTIHLEAEKDYLFEVDFESTSAGLSPGSLSCGMEEAITPEEYIAEAAKAAKDYEQVIVITGNNKDYETEGIDRQTMDLPPYQDALVEAVLESNPNTVVVLETGTPVTLDWESKAKAILHSGYLGQDLGNALYEVLYGEYNPSGKLSFTWPKKLEDTSAYTSFKLDNKKSLTYADDIFIGYRHHEIKKIEPRWAFGYGLSYTDFKLENLKVKVTEETIELSVDVQNIGAVSGSTVVQAYVSPQSPTVPYALKALKGFTKLEIGAGKSSTATISLDKKLACSFYDESVSQWKLEAGEYKVSVGFASNDIACEETFNVEKTATWVKL